jgi:hypothetical protein
MPSVTNFVALTALPDRGSRRRTITMTTHPLGRFSGSIFTALLAVSVASCGETPPPDTTGSGGDIAPIPPSPLCGPSANQPGVEGDFAGPTPTSGGGIFSPFQPQFGSTVAAAVPPPAISGGTLRILADGHTAVAADPDRDRVYVVDLNGEYVSCSCLATRNLCRFDEFVC